MSQVTDTTAASGVSFLNVTGQRSPQLALAMLMLNLADTNKKAAMDGIKDIEAQQAQKKQLADLLNEARDNKQKGLHINDAGIPSGLDDNFLKLCKENGISVPHYAKYADSKENLDKKWDIASPSSRLRWTARAQTSRPRWCSCRT